MNMIDIKYKKAFSMLEVIFVIVILGIVSSIGAEIIADTYNSYVIERATHRSSIKTELAANQIANRLTYAIPRTVIGKRQTTGAYRAVDNLNANDFDILEWIGYDNDSFSANRVPGWSGFIDLDASNATTLDTKGSNLDTTNTIIGHLSGGNSDINDAAIFCPGEYNVDNVWYNGNNRGVIPLNASNGTTLNVPNLAGQTVTEHYKLAWSAYALVPSDNGDGTFDLVLHYDYQPWEGESYGDGKNQILVRNVSVFKFVGSDNTIRFKLCQQEKITNDKTITICKEKAVIR
jgi:prepilin-type N-terminal cleavage/methylation domain-containing protein